MDEDRGSGIAGRAAATARRRARPRAASRRPTRSPRPCRPSRGWGAAGPTPTGWGTPTDAPQTWGAASPEAQVGWDRPPAGSNGCLKACLIVGAIARRPADRRRRRAIVVAGGRLVQDDPAESRRRVRRRVPVRRPGRDQRRARHRRTGLQGRAGSSGGTMGAILDKRLLADAPACYIVADGRDHGTDRRARRRRRGGVRRRRGSGRRSIRARDAEHRRRGVLHDDRRPTGPPACSCASAQRVVIREHARPVAGRRARHARSRRRSRRPSAP